MRLDNERWAYLARCSRGLRALPRNERLLIVPFSIDIPIPHADTSRRRASANKLVLLQTRCLHAREKRRRERPWLGTYVKRAPQACDGRERWCTKHGRAYLTADGVTQEHARIFVVHE